MIKTLRLTSVAAVVLAIAVLASVLGFLRPDSLAWLHLGARNDQQIDKLLEGSSAVERFQTLSGKTPVNPDTTPPLVKQADLFAAILNPPPDPTLPATKLPPRLSPVATKPAPIGPVSGNFDLLGTCYSDDPKSSFAYIQMPDKTCRWAYVGDEIGRLKIKEIHKGSIVCFDGKQDVEKAVQATPETSTLLETGMATTTPVAAVTEPPVAAKPKAPVKPIRPAVATVRPSGLSTPAPSTQISKEEQENLSRLGSQLKAAAAADPNAVNKVISNYKAAAGNVPQGIQPAPVNPNANPGDWKASMKEQTRREWQKRLAVPRSLKK